MSKSAGEQFDSCCSGELLNVELSAVGGELFFEFGAARDFAQSEARRLNRVVLLECAGDSWMVSASSRQKSSPKVRSETEHLLEADHLEDFDETFDLGEYERLEILEESAGSYVEDHARSEESGWYYSDED